MTTGPQYDKKTKRDEFKGFPLKPRKVVRNLIPFEHYDSDSFSTMCCTLTACVEVGGGSSQLLR